MSPKMFPHTITIYARTYTSDDVAGSIPHDGNGVSMAANVQSAGMDKAMLLPGDDANSVQGQSFYDVSTQTDPGLKANDTISWNGLTLIVQDAPSLVFRGRIYRTRCVVRQ